MSKKVKTSLIFLTAAISGCSSLEVNRLDPGIINAGTTSGLVYPLQFTQFTVKLTRGISNCETVKDGGNPDKSGDLYHDVKPFFKAEIKSGLVDDGDNIYVVDSESLNGFTKVTDLTMTWKDGRLSAINASADDKTGEIVTAVASGVAKIALASLGGGAAPAAGPRLIQTLACTNETKAALQNVVRHQRALKSASTIIEQLTITASEQEADLNKTGKKPNLSCGDVANTDEVQCKLQATVAQLRTQQKALASATAGLKSSIAKISYEQTITWPETSKIDTSEPFAIPKSNIDRWVTKEIKEHPNSRNIPPYQINDVAFQKQFETIFLLKKIGSYGKTELSAPQEDGGAKAGIRYRVPAIGYLVVCKNDPMFACDRNIKETSIASLVGPIMQYGHIFSVPFKSRAFSDASFSLTFDNQGRLAEAKVAQTTAPGEGAANTIQSLAETYAEIEVAKIAKEKTELETLQEQIELAKAQKEFADAQGALNPGTTPLAELQQRIALAKAEKEYIDAQNALLPEIDEKPSAIEEEVAVLEAETTLLLAKAANLQAMISVNQATQALD